MKKLIITQLLIFFFLFTGCSFGRGMAGDQPISKTVLLMDTVVTITLYDCDDETVLEDAVDLCAELEVQFSNTKENGEIWLVNKHAGEDIYVSDSTIELLQLGQSYEQLSNGLFTMEIGSLSTLWDFHEESQYFPTEEEINAAKAVVDTSALYIKEDTVSLTQGGTKLDVGAIAKGYIADCIKNYLEQRGVASGIINLGGNVLTIGSKPNGEPFVIGIQKPFGSENETVVGVKVEDSSVVTSGVYQRYFKRDGKLYHHILDPNTGYPAKTDLYSVTIFSKNSVDGDALSTICMLLGKEEGMAFVEEMDGIEGIFITEENEIYYTSGIKENLLIR